MYKITSKATSANIGAGFDCLGICYETANVFTFSFYDAKKLELVINGSKDQEKNKANLVAKSFYTACNITGRKPPNGVDINIDTYVPMSRGLGSSATCISAGVVCAFLLAGGRFSLQEIFDISAKIEGHPDNVSANIFGGGTLSYLDNKGKYKHVGFSVHDKFNFVAMVPPFKLPTQLSRACLPNNYSKEDTVFNISRAALCMSALQSGDAGVLADALEDKIHQPYRSKLIEGYEDASKAAMRSGAIGTFLSGAGPTIVAVFHNKLPLGKLETELAKECPSWEVMPLEISSNGLLWQQTAKA
ncbi:MAG: homoserine kinase [Eubacteriaceae bacterium]|nr:homoserine kinase [Eubacteriaceae bacterium]